MSEKTLEAFRKAIAAHALEDFELFESKDGFFIIKIIARESLHEFFLPHRENILHIFFNYMDTLESLEDPAIKLEALWNSFAFEFRILSRYIANHEQGLEIYADFQHSPLVLKENWEDALRTAGLCITVELSSTVEMSRHFVVSTDHLLEP